MRSKRQSLVLALLLVVVTVALYYPVRHLPFINYDDNLYVTENVNVQSGIAWDTVQWAFTTYHASNWHPLTWLSHALDCQLFGLDPTGPHLVNLLLHVCNVVLLFWVLLRATGFAGRSAMVAALFALHPINVETVAWIAERKNLLSMLFFLLALGAYRWYAREPRISRYAVVGVLFCFGLMAKPQIITLPFVLLLWDYWPLQRMVAAADRNAHSVRTSENRLLPLVCEKLPLFAIAAASAVITLLAHRANGIRSLPLSLRVANAIISYARYVKFAFWPSHLALFYPHPLVSLQNWAVVAAFLGLALVTWMVIENRRRGYPLVGWFWFLITLLPMIGIVQVGTQAMADRYAYLPLIGLFIMVSWGGAEWAERVPISLNWQVVGSVVILLALFSATHRQLTYWHDSVTLWTHTLEATHGNLIAEVDLGAALLQRGETARAMEHFRAAKAIDPLDPFSNMYIARDAQAHNNLPEAIEAYKTVIRTTQDSGLKARAFSNMGYAYQALGDEAEAQKCFHAATEQGP
jgi:protein O-mannosyl-transferase